MYYFLCFVTAGVGGRYNILVYLLFFIIFIYMIIKKKKIIIPKEINLFFLIAFSITYIAISTVINQQEVSAFSLIGPIIAYYSGLIIIEFTKEDNKQKYIMKCIIAILIGFFIHAMLNFSINIGSESRNTIDFWSGNIMSATLQGTLLTPILSLILFTFVYINKKSIKVVMIIFFALALAYDMIIATRSVIIITILVFVISLISYIVLENKIRNKFKIILMILVSILIVSIMYNENVLEIRTKVEKSNLFSRIENAEIETKNSDNARINAQIDAIKQILDYPFGAPENVLWGGLSYAHNMWFDVAKRTGIIPFSLLIIFFLSNIYSLIRIIRNTDISTKLKMLLISVYMCFLLIFLVEPILQGMPIIFIAFCIIASFVDSINKSYEIKDIKKIYDINAYLLLKEKK